MVAAEKRSGGCIVNVSSQASMKAIAEHAFYAASKAGMDMMTKVMALELGKHNVRKGKHMGGLCNCGKSIHFSK